MKLWNYLLQSSRSRSINTRVLTQAPIEDASQEDLFGRGEEGREGRRENEETRESEDLPVHSFSHENYGEGSYTWSSGLLSQIIARVAGIVKSSRGSRSFRSFAFTDMPPVVGDGQWAIRWSGVPCQYWYCRVCYRVARRRGWERGIAPGWWQLCLADK